MFPPPLAALTFHDDTAGSATALAARFANASPERPVLLLGADRPELVVAVARHARALVVVDSSRSTLRRARDAAAMESLADDVTFLAADPRDMEIPGGVRSALIPSLVWRALSTEQERVELLACLRQELVPDGLLCLDLEAIPDGGGPLELVSGGLTFRVTPFDEERVRVETESLPAPLLLSARSPGEALAEIERAGFEPEDVSDAATGEAPDAGSVRVWITARAPGAAAE